jgi:hypothetical protein
MSLQQSLKENQIAQCKEALKKAELETEKARVELKTAELQQRMMIALAQKEGLSLLQLQEWKDSE